MQLREIKFKAHPCRTHTFAHTKTNTNRIILHAKKLSIHLILSNFSLHIRHVKVTSNDDMI